MPRPSCPLASRPTLSASPWRALWAPAPLPCGPLCLRLDLSPMRGPAQRLTDIAVMSELRGLLWVALGFRPGAPDLRHQKEFWLLAFAKAVFP